MNPFATPYQIEATTQSLPQHATDSGGYENYLSAYASPTEVYDCSLPGSLCQPLPAIGRNPECNDLTCTSLNYKSYPTKKQLGSSCDECTRADGFICSKPYPGVPGKRMECADECCGAKSFRILDRQSALVDKSRGTFRNSTCDGMKLYDIPGVGTTCGKFSDTGMFKQAPMGCCALQQPPEMVGEMPSFNLKGSIRGYTVPEWVRYSQRPETYGLLV